MPFDGSGNFTRLYSWAQDRDNGIKILAPRMDAEFDNFAGGMNQVFFRNGIVPMTGTLNMGQNYITGLGAGSAGALPIRFGDDTSSGMYLNGFGKPTIVAGGQGRIEANNVGVTMTGDVVVNGTLKRGANTVWDAGNFVPGNYALLTGATFTGPVALPNLAVRDPSNSSFASWGNNVSLYVIGVSAVFDALRARNANTNQDLWNATTTTFTTAGGIEANGAIRQSGQQVFHSGNFNPGNYALLSGAQFTSNTYAYNSFRVNTPSRGGAAIESPGDTTNPGYVGFFNPAGARVGFVGYAIGNRLGMFAENGFVGYSVSGDLVRNGQGAYVHQAQAGLSSTMSRGTSAPSGGSDGDIYFQYT